MFQCNIPMRSCSRVPRWKRQIVRQRPPGGYLCVLLLVRRCLLSVAFCPSPPLRASRISKKLLIAGQPNAHHGLPRTRRNRLSQNDFSNEASLEDTVTPQCSNSKKPLSEIAREAYVVGETDGILDLARNLSFDTVTPDALVAASVEAAAGNKRQLSGMLNAWIGSCCLLADTSAGAEWAWELLLAFDEASDSIGTYPDIVTLSLTYSALSRSHQQHFHTLAENVLERAAKLSKKNGGSKRRRALAASRRQGAGNNAKDLEEELQELCGCDFHVLQETGDFVVVSKPSGMVCFHKHKTTAGRITSVRKHKKGQEGRKVVDISLEDALLHHNVPLSTLNHEGRGLVHRIDRGTSGCIILAKSDEMHARLLSEFFLRRVKKSYYAVVASNGDLPRTGIVDICVHGRPAKSSFSVVDHYGSEALCLRVETFTGRKHQVRVHCAQGLGHPVLMDPIYDTENAQALSKHSSDTKQRFFLHASSLCIPEYGVEIEAPLPSWWKEAVASFQ